MAGEYEKAITIQEAIENIVHRRYLLPAIQRKFTWSQDQICVLFDSIMRGYPINTFMLWKVKDESVRNSFRFYSFLENYCERFNENNPEFNVNVLQDSFYAVIDGQQRLTSLYIGLSGTYAYRLARKWWPKTRDESVLPTRRLYLNLLKPLDVEQNEAMMKYEFEFLTAAEYDNDQKIGNKYWFEVGKVLQLPEVETLDKVPLKVVLPVLKSFGIGENEYSLEVLNRLYCAFRKDTIIHFYCESNQSIDHVLDIFIRTNHGGTPLSFSDLLMSIAIANWQKDARQQIDDLVDRIRFELDFSVDRNIVLKTCLMLIDADVRFKVQNFNQETVKRIEQEWEGIKKCLFETFNLIRSFGLNDFSLRAKNAAIPISFYLYKKINPGNGKSLYESINNPAKHSGDRKLISKWLNMSMLRGIFGGQSDGVLTKLRNIITLNKSNEHFPLNDIVTEYKGTNKDIVFDDEFIDRLLATQYDDQMCFSILALLFPDLDYSKAKHIDHLHPASAFNKKSLEESLVLSQNPELRTIYENKENWNSIVNLYPLDASLNSSKKHLPLKDWIEKEDVPIRKEDLMVSSDIDLSFSNFKVFIDNRREHMKSKLLNLVREIDG